MEPLYERGGKCGVTQSHWNSDHQPIDRLYKLNTKSVTRWVMTVRFVICEAVNVQIPVSYLSFVMLYNTIDGLHGSMFDYHAS